MSHSFREKMCNRAHKGGFVWACVLLLSCTLLVFLELINLFYGYRIAPSNGAIGSNDVFTQLLAVLPLSQSNLSASSIQSNAERSFSFDHLNSNMSAMLRSCDFRSEKMDISLVQDWTNVISDWFQPYTRDGIWKNDVDDTFKNPGDHIIVQYINGSFYLLDPGTLCTTGGAEKKLFLTWRCQALWSILNATVAQGYTGCKIPNFEFVFSVDDLPRYRSQSTTLNYKPMPGFGAIGCWQKGFLSFPMFGSHAPWDIREVDKHIEEWMNQNPRPFSERQAKVVFRGGSRTCSFAPELDTLLDWEESAFTSASPRPCGRDLLKQISYKHPSKIDFGDDHMDMRAQEDQYKYTVTVEGHGGWTDRLFRLMFHDVGLMIQEHPCPEWFEYMFKPFQHYIPVSNNLDNIIGRLGWAEHHPKTVEEIIKEKKMQAKRVLSQKGITTFSVILWTMYSSLLKYDIQRRDRALEWKY